MKIIGVRHRVAVRRPAILITLRDGHGVAPVTVTRQIPTAAHTDRSGKERVAPALALQATKVVHFAPLHSA
jgi:hypothetical protein